MPVSKKLESFFEILEKQSKPVPNDKRQSRYCEYITRFASHFGKERVYLAGSTVTQMRLRSDKDEGDYDYLIISGISIPKDALEHRSDVPCFVHIRTDKVNTFVFDEDLKVDGKYLHSKVLKELDKRAFEITSGLYAVLTTPKHSQGRQTKHVELNREAKPGISQMHYAGADVEGFNTTELYRREPNEDSLRQLNSAIQSSSLSSSMKGILDSLLCMLANSKPEDFANSLLFQSLGNLIEAATSSEKGENLPKAKRSKIDSDKDDRESGKSYSLRYHYKSSKDFIAAFPIDGPLQCMDEWKRNMISRESSFWPKEDTINKIFASEVYVVAKPAIVSPDLHRDLCLGFNQAERLLAESLSSDQRLCMLLLKSLQKGFLGEYSDVLTTFHWSTAFYHKCEEIDPALFNRKTTILQTFNHVLSYMAECLKNRYLRHYFIESNLIAHISPKEADEIAAKIKQVLNDPESALQVYFEKRERDAKPTCTVSERELRRPEKEGETFKENMVKTLANFQEAARGDDSKLAKALLDTLFLALQMETDFIKTDIPESSKPGNNLSQLIAKGIQYQTTTFSNREDTKRALNELRSSVFGSLLSSFKK